MADCMCDLKLVDFLNDVAWYYVITYCAFRVQGTIWSYPRSLSHDLTSYTSHVWILTPSPSKNLFSACHNLSPPMLKVFVGRDGYRNWQVYLVRGAVDEGKVGILGGICVGPMKNQKSPAINSMHHGKWTFWPQRHGGLVQMMFLVQLGWSGDLSRFIFRGVPLNKFSQAARLHWIFRWQGKQGKLNDGRKRGGGMASLKFETTREKKGENIYMSVIDQAYKNLMSNPCFGCTEKNSKTTFPVPETWFVSNGTPCVCIFLSMFEVQGLWHWWQWRYWQPRNGQIGAGEVDPRYQKDARFNPKNTSGMSQERPVFVGERG